MISINCREARLKSSLDRLYNFSDDGTMPLRRYFDLHPPMCKSVYIQKYSSKRIHLEYKELANPKKHYTIWVDDNRGIDVPKIVYDWLPCPVKDSL